MGLLARVVSKDLHIYYCLGEIMVLVVVLYVIALVCPFLYLISNSMCSRVWRFQQYFFIIDLMGDRLCSIGSRVGSCVPEVVARFPFDWSQSIRFLMLLLRSPVETMTGARWQVRQSRKSWVAPQKYPTK